MITNHKQSFVSVNRATFKVDFIFGTNTVLNRDIFITLEIHPTFYTFAIIPHNIIIDLWSVMYHTKNASSGDCFIGIAV